MESVSGDCLALWSEMVPHTTTYAIGRREGVADMCCYGEVLSDGKVVAITERVMGWTGKIWSLAEMRSAKS